LTIAASFKTLATKLQKLQNRAARILTFFSYDANVDDLFKILGWKKLDVQRKIQTATVVYKSIYGLAPAYLRSQFTNRSDISSYTLRDCEGKLAIHALSYTHFLKKQLQLQWCGAVE